MIKKPKSTALIGISFYALIIVIFYSFGIIRKLGVDNIFGLFLSFLPPFLAIFFGFLALRNIGFSSDLGKMSFYLTLSILLWFIGDIFWTLSLEAHLFSMSGLLWLVSYLPLMISYYYFIKFAKRNFFETIPQIFTIFIFLFFLILVYMYLFYLSWDFNIGFLENILASGYFITDICLFFVGIIVIFLLLRTDLIKPFLLIFFGLFLHLIVELYYVFNYADYNLVNSINIFWDLGYLSFALGFILFAEKYKKK